jgi:uncharacterized protein YndB with AHSA1/START domain
MVDIRHRVGINAPAQSVYEAFTTTEGLASWWTTHVEGDASQGGKVAFWFGRPEPSAIMEVVAAEPASRITWRCVEGPEEWVGTTVNADLREEGDETIVLFTHGGWREPVEFMHHCSTRWGVFMLSLKYGLEGGTATPYPNDPHICSWD